LNASAVVSSSVWRKRHVWSDSPTVEDARDSEEREWLLEQERRFVGYCPRELGAIAHAAIEFAVASRIQYGPD